MRVLVCGGREYADWKRITALLDRIHAQNGITLIIEGGATGADQHARTWAWRNKVENESYPADWDNLNHHDAVIRVNSSGKQYDAMAGFRRNQQMLTEGRPELVIGFPGDNGTQDMLKRAVEAEVPTLRIGAPADAPQVLMYDADGNEVRQPETEWLFAPDPNAPKKPRRAPPTPEGRYEAEF